MKLLKRLFNFKTGLVIMSAIMISACTTQMQNTSHGEIKQAKSIAVTVSQNAGEVTPQATAPKEDPNRIEEGDFVTAHYSLRLMSGELLVTSSEQIAQDPGEKKVAWFLDQEKYGPEQIIAGNENQTPELAVAVIGMTTGQKRSVPIEAEKGFGPVDERLIKTYSTRKRMSRITKLSAQEFVAKFKRFPKTGREVNLVPYYKSKIIGVDDRTVTLEALALDGKIVEDDVGSTQIKVSGEEIHMTLSPKVGALFMVGKNKGIIVEAGTENFKVDYNHPGAGKMLSLDVDILSFQKASAFQSNEPVWIEDHDTGFEVALTQVKPMVLVLYAGWCGWSKRFLNETVMDPRIQAYWDAFVWVKVDSDKEKYYHELYGQNGYPMIVLFNDQGEIIKKLDGFKDPRAFVKELEECKDVDLNI